MDTSRYARQIILPELGGKGQETLSESSVLVVGAGGLGSPAIYYLAAAGIGNISVADADEVRMNNLNRQILYNLSDLGSKKTDSLKKNIGQFNDQLRIKTIGRIDESNIYEILSEDRYDAVIDGTDNFETRFILNDACVEKKIPFIYGSVLGWEGQVSVFDSVSGPCYQCVFREAPAPELSPTCVEAGVIGVTPGIIGTLQASEAIKTILKSRDRLVGKMLVVDLLRTNFRTFELNKDPLCPSCSNS